MKLPDKYPSGCDNKKIEEMIKELEAELKRDASLDNPVAFSSVVRYSSLIQLGQTTLTGRFTKRYSLLALFVSIIALLVAWFK